MKKLPLLLYAFLFSLLVLPLMGEANISSELQVTPLERTLQSNGRNIVTLRFNLRSQARQGLTLQEKLQLPKGWHVISVLSSFTLQPKSADTRLIHVIVPSNAQAKAHRIAYRVINQATGSVLADESVTVSIKAVAGVSLKRVTPPLTLLAGDVYSLAFVLTNTGNTTESYRIDVDDHNGYMTQLNATKAVIKAGKNHSISIKGRIPLTVDAESQHRLTLRVRSSAGTQIEKIHIPLIAREHKGVGQYHKLYGELRTGLSFNSSGDGDEQKTQLVTSYSTRGSLDKAGRHQIDMQLRNGYDFDQPFDASPEHYQLNYKYDDLTLSAGHQLFSGSALSGQALSGIGGRANYKYSNKSSDLEIDTFIGQSKPDAEEQRRVSGGSVGYHFNTLPIEAKLGVIHSSNDEQSDTLFSLESAWSGEFVSGKAELAYDGKQMAQRFDINAQYNDVSAHINYVQGDADFKGNYANKRQLQSGVSWQVSKQNKLDITYRKSNDNLNYDLTKPVQQSEEGRVRLSHQLRNNNTHVSVGYSVKSDRDKREDSSVDDELQAAFFAINHSFDDIDLTAQWDQGRKQDHIKGTDLNGSRQALGVNWKINEDWHLNGSYSRSVGLDDQTNQALSMQAKYRLNAQQQITADVRHSRSNIDNGQSSALSLSYSQKLAKQRRIDVQLNHSTSSTDNDLAVNDTNVRFDFVMPLDIPFKHRRDIATLCGQTLLNGRAVANIVLQLDGQYAVSDAGGRFCYRHIVAKNYTLQVDNSHQARGGSVQGYIMQGFGQQRPIQLVAGESKNLTIALSQGAQVSGRLLKLNEHKANEGMAGAVIHLMPIHHSDNDTQQNLNLIQRTTDASGFFNFSGLPSGKWKVMLSDHARLPEHHHLRQRFLVVDLRKGEEKTIVFEVVPKVQGIEKVGPKQGFSVVG